MIGKTFSIDLTSLYEYIGDGKTEYGYYIDHEEDGINEWHDLRSVEPNLLYACDGEVCVVSDKFEADGKTVYSIHLHDEEYARKFWLTAAEFEIASNSPVGKCRFCGSDLYHSANNEYEYQCFNCDEDFYKFEQDSFK